MRRRERLGFVLLGLLNNLSFVVSNAHAGELLPGQLALVYIINTIPGLAVKLTAPYWWHLSTYGMKITLTGACFGANLLLMTIAPSVSLRLLGVALGDLGAGLGEASILALSQFHEDPKGALSMWSCGTGLAGVAGYLVSMYLMPVLGQRGGAAPIYPAGPILLGAAVVGGYWAAFFRIVGTPWVDALRGARRHTAAEPASADGDDGRPAGEIEAADKWADGRPLLAQAALSSASSPSPVPDAPVDGAAQLSRAERLRLQLSLWPYILPLLLVYWSEYACQAGAWTAFALPAAELHSQGARNRAYQVLNLAYQVGVLISRSSGELFTIGHAARWALAVLQLVLLVLFVADALAQAVVGDALVAPALGVGLIGGTLYVQTFMAIDRELPPDKRELALATSSVADTTGILLADVTGLYVQWCVFDALAIQPRSGECPL